MSETKEFFLRPQAPGCPFYNQNLQPILKSGFLNLIKQELNECPFESKALAFQGVSWKESVRLLTSRPRLTWVRQERNTQFLGRMQKGAGVGS